MSIALLTTSFDIYLKMAQVEQSQGQLSEEKAAEKIQNVRLQKEFQYLRSINRSFEIADRNEVVFKDMLDDHQNIHVFIPKEYPFREPLYALSNTLDDRRPVSQVIEEWVPKIKIFELIEFVAQRLNQRQKIKQEVNNHILLKAFHSPASINLIIMLAIVIRIIVALGSYSGQKDSPNYGDFQAHRNWMSITVNRPIAMWYEQYQEQPWWRIDYPPVAAYLSYIFGRIYQTIEAEAMQLQKGYESESLKVYMRFTSLLVDLIFLFPPIYLLSNYFQKKIPQLFLLLLLLKPDVIVIDHGHFQYNSLILGLILMAFYCLLKQHYYVTCFLFTIAIHSKQMAVYYSLAFLAGLVGVTYSQYKFNRPKLIAQIVKYGTIVVITSLLIWAPWLGSFQNLNSVITAIFPVHRGLYQLKVSNFWCISDTIMNWQAHFSKTTLVIFCFISSVVMSLPSIFSLVLNPTRKSLILGFTTISLTFFMFSYHVHQKSILLPLLLIPFAGQIIGGWFTHQFIIAGCSGLFHLLKEDNQEFGYFGIMIIYVLFDASYILLRSRIEKAPDEQELTLEWHNKLYERWFFRILFMIAVITLHVVALVADPPQKLPYLWHLLFALFSFAYNLYFLILSNLLQLEWIYFKVTNKRIKDI